MSWSLIFFHPPGLLRTLMVLLVLVSAPMLGNAQNNSSAETVSNPSKVNPRVQDDNAPLFIQAETINGRPDREVRLKQKAEIIRDILKLNADQAIYHQVENEVEASGQVRLQRFGDRYTGDAVRFNVDASTGCITNPTYKLELNNAQGKAERINFEGEDRVNVVRGTYSTCEGGSPDWYLKSDSLQIDMGRDVGKASNAALYFKGVPILGAPTMSFPLSGERKSGVLPPTIEFGTNGLSALAVPYYVNIAPNRDLTLYPKLITQRGLQLGADGRYLGRDYKGETNAEVLFDDQQTKTNRYSLASTHTQTLMPHLSFGWNVNVASDDNYPSDFAKTITASSQRQLVRELRSDYSGAQWNASARLQNYQILQDPAAILDPTLKVDRPYDRLPQLTFHSGNQNENLNWNFDSELTRFSHPEKVSGDRLVLNPKISYPFVSPAYFLTPKLSLHLSNYQLDSSTNTTAGPSAFSRTVPTFSLDGGLYFERDTSFFGQAIKQTLEPRLFYVNTPYRDQSLYPNFDSGEATFNFAQLFSENRFVGSDRIGDANQLTAALVSRYSEASGIERLRLAIGQRFYFKDQRVVLDATNPVQNSARSDLLLSANGRLSPSLSVDSAIQYNESTHNTYSSNYGLQWQPKPKHVMNVEYRYLRDSFEQFNLSAQWPIAQRWYAVGRNSYSLPERKTVDSLFGLEYSADCWIFRLVGQHFVTATQTASTQIFIQLELNGLSKLGSNPLESLKKSIPGYQQINQSK